MYCFLFPYHISILLINIRQGTKKSREGRVGVEPTVELTFTRLTVWTFRPLKQPILFSSPYGIRTHILGLEDRCPVQLNEGTIFFVPLVGVEPTLLSELVSKTSACYQFRHKGI